MFILQIFVVIFLRQSIIKFNGNVKNTRSLNLFTQKFFYYGTFCLSGFICYWQLQKLKVAGAQYITRGSFFFFLGLQTKIPRSIIPLTYFYIQDWMFEKKKKKPFPLKYVEELQQVVLEAYCCIITCQLIFVCNLYAYCKMLVKNFWITY